MYQHSPDFNETAENTVQLAFRDGGGTAHSINEADGRSINDKSKGLRVESKRVPLRTKGAVSN